MPTKLTPFPGKVHHTVTSITDKFSNAYCCSKQERNLSLESAMKVGRSVARVKPAVNNAIFDCKVLSRNHALLWYKDGKVFFISSFFLFLCVLVNWMFIFFQFYLQDTKSSNGTFVNNQRLSKGSEESAPREVCSGDIVQFGVDVMENSRKGILCYVVTVPNFHAY